MASRSRRSWLRSAGDTGEAGDTPSPLPVTDRARPIVLDVANRPRTGCPTPYRPSHGRPSEPREPRVPADAPHVDDVYDLLTTTSKRLDTVWGVQRRHGNRLEEIQQSLDLQTGRLDRMEDNQRDQRDRLGRIEDTQQQILALLRGPSES